MRISIDLDGVIADFWRPCVEIIHRLFPDKPALPSDYEPNDWYGSEILTHEEWLACFEEVKKNPTFWIDQPHYDTNLLELAFWANCFAKSDIFFITARAEVNGESAMSQTAMWLKARELFPREGHSCVIRVKNTQDKATLMQMLNIQYSLDDHGPTIEECLKVPGHRAYLLDRRYNKDFNLPRVADMSDFLKKVYELEFGEKV